MAEENASSRSEAPTARRLLEARRQGITPRSADLTVCCVLLFAAGTVFFFGSAWLAHLRGLLAAGWAGQMGWADLLRNAAEVALPPLMLIFFLQLVAPLLLSGWIFVPAQFEFRRSRIALWRAFLRPWQWAGVADFVKAVIKLAVLATAVVWLARNLVSAAALWFGAPTQESMNAVGEILLKSALVLAVALVLPAVLDALDQWWRHWRDLRMSVPEVLAESREAEISPQIFARLQQRASERRAALFEDEA